MPLVLSGPVMKIFLLYQKLKERNKICFKVLETVCQKTDCCRKVMQYD